MNYMLITDIDKSIDESLGYYKVISSRTPNFGKLIGFYRESISRNTTITMFPGDLERNSNRTEVNTVNYFLEKSLENEKKYN